MLRAFAGNLFLTKVKSRLDPSCITIEEKYRRLNELISVGMNIDNAANILKENGYTVGNKEYPTAQKDYSQILVPLSKKIPASATIAETIGKGKGKNIYAIIKADENGIIFEIYH